MSSESEDFLVAVDLQVHSYAGSDYPVVMVTFPEHLLATLEILAFDVDRLAIYERNSTDLALMVDGRMLTIIDNRNGNLAEFKTALSNSNLFALTLTTVDQNVDDVMYIITRTVVADNYTGRVISNTGPKKMSYAAACEYGDETPKDHVTGRSFRSAVEIAVAMRDDVLKQNHGPSSAN